MCCIGGDDAGSLVNVVLHMPQMIWQRKVVLLTM